MHGGERGVALGLNLAHLVAAIAVLAHQVGLGEAALDVTEFVVDVALDVAGPFRVQLHGARCPRCLRRA